MVFIVVRVSNVKCCTVYRYHAVASAAVIIQPVIVTNTFLT